MKETIRKRLRDSGAGAIGFAKAGKISKEAEEKFLKWLSDGCHGEMEYMQRHAPLRSHTDNVLPGANTVITLAFSFFPEEWRDSVLPLISCYAFGEDYHNVLRQRISPIVEALKKEYGGNWRVCIDTAPVAERYWAMESGIGKLGKNGCVIVEGAGSFCFLVEILTTLKIEPDKSTWEWCDDCGACEKLCPGRALRGDGTMDCRQCINYLTIEKKGEFNEEEKRILENSKISIAGCDICLKVCPHNRGLKPTNIEEFRMLDIIRTLDVDRILSMETEEFNKSFSKSPLRYIKHQKILRNILLSKK